MAQVRLRHRPSRLRPHRLGTGAAAVCALLACGKDPVAPGDALDQSLTSAHYVYHFAAGDGVDTTWQERYYAWVVSALQLTATGRLDYFKYRDRAHLEAVTGRVTNGFAEPGTTRFHTIWREDNHEGVHTLVVLYIGHPPALFNEGVAVAHQTDPFGGVYTPRWNGQDLHQLARGFDLAGRLPPLSALLPSTGFFQLDDQVTYPVAGSFVRWLLDSYGVAPFKALLNGATFDDSATQTEARFQAAYAMSLSTAWAAWRTFLGVAGARSIRPGSPSGRSRPDRG